MLWLSVEPAVLSVDPAVVLVSAPSLGCDFKCSSTGAAGGQPWAAQACMPFLLLRVLSRREFSVVEESQARERDVGAIKTSAPLTSRPTRNENALPKISVQLAIALDFWRAAALARRRPRVDCSPTFARRRRNSGASRAASVTDCHWRCGLLLCEGFWSTGSRPRSTDRVQATSVPGTAQG